MTSKVTYLGGLRTESEHLKSGDTFLTDAPTDNNGKGEAFSPTDTVATGLASCMLTVMGIKAESLDLDISNSTAEVTKTMASNPRRISKIDIVMNMSAKVDEQTKSMLEKVANTCPVRHSLHPEIEKNIVYNWR